MKQDKLSTQPVKGFRDFVPSDWKIQQYIFNTWRKVCSLNGYQEYNGPVVEYASIYNKSGDEIGNTGKDLYSFSDRAERTLALRPEMTPTVGRMIAAYEKSYPKPIRWFSIAQFFRAERPQKGRGREFFQLNADIFGDDSVYSDFEIIQLIVNVMEEFGATSDMYEVRINNRWFASYYFENVLKIGNDEKRKVLLSIFDRFPKKGKEWLYKEIDTVGITVNQEDIEGYLNLDISKVLDYLSGLSFVKNDSSDSKVEVGILRFYKLLNLIQESDLKNYCVYDSTIARGLDYYTGTVFEAFDKNPENNRALVGGGRYDDLLSLYRNDSIPAVGFGWGDVTMRIFLENWGLLNDKLPVENIYYFPMLDENLYVDMVNIANKLRKDGKVVVVGTKPQSISGALRDANKREYSYVLIYGELERDDNVVKVKNMKTGEENLIKL